MSPITQMVSIHVLFGDPCAQDKLDGVHHAALCRCPQAVGTEAVAQGYIYLLLCCVKPGNFRNYKSEPSNGTGKNL